MSTSRRSKSGRKSTQKKTTRRPLRTVVPPHHLKQLIRKSEEYTARVKAPQYPHPDHVNAAATATGAGSDLSDLARLARERTDGIVAPQFPDPSQHRLVIDPDGFIVGPDHIIANATSLAKHGGPKKLPSPKLVEQEVLRLLGSMPVVGKEGNLVFGELNCEFGNTSKANYYAAAYQAIVERHHLIFLEEVDPGFVHTVGKANGYGHFAGTPNNRGQGVGFLVHPRLRLLGKPIEYPQITGVQGIPELRPAYRLDLEDATSGVKFSAVVVHLKSMRGGPAVTSPVRYQQLDILVKLLQGVSPVIISGDFNCFLDNTTDTQPLTNGGYKLVYPNDHTSTQQMGGRLDGYFTYQLTQKLGRYQIRPFWKNKQIGRAFTDHGLVSVVMYLPGGSPSTDPDDGNGSSDHEVKSADGQ